jgi:phosphoglycolate phosphatase-like HAD superfamily hydrolase
MGGEPMDNLVNKFIIVLDMDGVVLDSESVKIAAFASLFAAYPAQLPTIDQYNRAHRGVPRREKFIHVLTAILGLPAEESDLRRLGERYAAVLANALVDVPLVQGIDQFLQRDDFSFFLNSAAPLAEIEKLMQEKGLAHYFQAMYGYPSQKTEVLQQLKTQHSEQPFLFFGDGWADYEAAQSAGVLFIGVDTNSLCTFTQVDIPLINDFSNLDQVIKLINASIEHENTD